MDVHQLKPVLQPCNAIATAGCEGSDAQLEFGFVAQDRLAPAKQPLPDRSHRDHRMQNPGRGLRVVDAAIRPLEEMQLEHAVSSYLPPGKSLSLRLTENRHTIISVQRGRDGYRVRAHRMFARVEGKLVRALARYVVHNDPRASTLLGEFIEHNKHQIRIEPKRERRVVLRTRGRYHDLTAIFDRLNREHFGGAHEARITWGVARRPANWRSVKIGSYSVEDRLIRVSPLLDQEDIPRYFVDWIVFHEMLHGKHAIRQVAGRRCFHPPEFAQEERAFPDYARARLWEKTHMDRLLGG
jgi:predicted metal-dependent hydrolase